MIILVWIIAFILVIPTYGISLLVAVIVSNYIKKQEENETLQVMTMAAVALHINIIDHYNTLRRAHGLSQTKYSDSQIVEFTMNTVVLIETVLEKSNRFHNNKDDIIQLAIRFVAYSEDFNKEVASVFINEDLENVSIYGVNKVLARPYRKSRQ